MSELVTVPFHGDTLFALRDGPAIRVAVKPISDRLGLDWSSQHKRIGRDAILSQGMVIMTIPSAGGPQDTATLPLHLLPGWLFGVDAGRVKPEARPTVLTYQAECHEVLFRHFFVPREAEGVQSGHAIPSSPAREESAKVRKQLVAEARQTFGTRAAGALWFALGLPIVPEMHTPPRQGWLDLSPNPAPASR